jgi:hypothetical protein
VIRKINNDEKIIAERLKTIIMMLNNIDDKSTSQHSIQLDDPIRTLASIIIFAIMHEKR